MGVQVGLWRADRGRLERLQPTGVALESDLEEYIEQDPTLLGEPLLIIGRQVRTRYGGVVDLLAVDADGTVHVLELKRDRTPRDVTAQTLDYGAWVAGLSREDVLEVWDQYAPGMSFDAAFAEMFASGPPEAINEAQVLTIVATAVDEATERIVRFLNQAYGVPFNIVFFRRFRDGDASYLARTWLVDPDVPAAAAPTVQGRKKSRPEWNGRDWYVVFGAEHDGRVWADGVRYGFVTAGGGRVYSQRLQNLPVGGRVFVYAPQAGYIAVGSVTRPAVRFDDAVVTVDGADVPLADQPLEGRYVHAVDGGTDPDDVAEYVVTVDWDHTVSMQDAVWRQGLFANQNTACKLRHQDTIDYVLDAFGIDE